jgi:outer membrane protein assembly factor BamB
LVLEKSSWRNDAGGCGILVYAGKNGELLWQKDYQPNMTHFKEARTFIADGLLWIEATNNRVAGFDLQTGAEKKSWKSGGHHCSVPVATERFFIAAECNFTDLASGEQARARMFKSACRLPFIPANGLLYSFPVQCECYPMLRGYMGMAAGGVTKTAQRPRLERGPAYGRIAAKSVPGDAAAEWPMYRHDDLRSSSTPAEIRGKALQSIWTTQVARPSAAAVAMDWKSNPFVPGSITAPVVAGGSVFVAVPDEHRIAALDAASGKLRWSFTAGGRIDTPPSIHEDLCLFGAHDGWIYCVTADQGELAWKYRAAPQETWIMAYGQMESLWPAAGSVLMENGIAYVPAGRHPMSDGGVRVLALKARTGEVVWEKNIKDLGLKGWYSPMLPGTQRKAGLDFEPIDLLVKDGEDLAMSRWQFKADSGKFKLVLAATNYLAGGLSVPRGLWSYGIRQNKSVAVKAPAAFDQTALRLGGKADAALLLADGTLASMSTNSVLKVGERTLQLDAPPVHDGLAAAYGRVYISTREGKVVSVGDPQGK